MRGCIRKTFSSSHARGFTLLEVITVLIIASLLSVVLMQGLSLVLNLRTNLGSFLDDLDQKVLMRNRVSEPLRGVIADYTDGEHIFKGNSNKITGLTLKPLFSSSGRPTPFSLEIQPSSRDESVSLLYRESGSEPVALATWIGDLPRFKFLSPSGNWAEEWPTQNEPLELGAIGAIKRVIQLPAVIALDLNSEYDPDIAVSILARPDRVPRELPF